MPRPGSLVAAHICPEACASSARHVIASNWGSQGQRPGPGVQGARSPLAARRVGVLLLYRYGADDRKALRATLAARRVGELPSYRCCTDDRKALRATLAARRVGELLSYRCGADDGWKALRATLAARRVGEHMM
jgi:hypothetical protein